jgi:broad specificity phosphatase PhoE
VQLNRIVLVRHGETVGESSIRFHGSGDVALSDEGRAQMRAAAAQVPGEGFGLVVASRLQRAWEAATIMVPGRAVQLEPGFCEVDFGRWEGLTREEIAARDPELFEQWQAQPAEFGFPDGEKREDFRNRVHAGLGRLLATRESSAIVVAHKGIVREIVEKLTGTRPESEEVGLGAVLQVTRRSDGSWHRGRRSSNPPGLEG